MRASSLRSLFLLSTLLALLAVSQAQVAVNGRITGVVRDISGAVVEGATIEVRSPALIGARTVVTQAGGVYLMEQLPAGTYTVTCKQDGFETHSEGGIVLRPGFTATINLNLQPGSTSTMVEVTGSAPLIDVQAAAAPTTFDTAVLDNIPSGRDPWSTIAQTPGASLGNFDVAGSNMAQQTGTSIHGSKSSEQAYSFNGLNLSWPGGSGGSTAFYVDYDSFDAIQLVTDAAPPEVSVGGAYINMVTKSGSNNIHGMLSTYYLTDATQATLTPPSFTPINGSPTTVSNAGTPFIMSRDLTAQAGGPIIKDKLWLFAGYRFYVTKMQQLQIRNPDGGFGTDPNHQTNGTVRLDYRINDSNTFNGVWLYNIQNRFIRRSTAYSFVETNAANRQIEPAYALQSQWVSTLSPTLLLDTRVGYMHLHFDMQRQPGVGSDVLSVADVGASTLRNAAQTYTLSRSGMFRAASSLSWFKAGWGGSHNFKVGGDWALASANQDTTVNQDINVFYNNGDAFQVRAYNTPITSQSLWRSGSFFLQDAWSIKQRLTLNVGFRY
ncbi:MAG: carboxypeptidase regulatory-like domain-containing protein, partial [Candidatus Korobacteraceae bacterium]